MKFKVISIDLAKNVFQLCGMDSHQKIIFNKKVKRESVLKNFSNIEADMVVMEACYSSNYWARTLEEMGFNVKLIPPFQVKPFVVGNKNDHNDAIAIAEASLRPTARFVPVKSVEQQDIQSLDRIRERLIKQRTAIINQLRGLLSEYGVVLPTGAIKFLNEIPYALEDAENKLSVIARQFLSDLHKEALDKTDTIKKVEQKMESLLSDNSSYELLQSIHGVGPVTAAALIASVSSGKQFKNGRNMAAWLGLTPGQHSSGDNDKNTGMTKRGNRQLRRLFIHGARTVMNWHEGKGDKLSLWIKGLLTRMHPCKAIVAIANKLARIAWSVLVNQRPYKMQTETIV